jgi:hypothetical protein
MAHVPQLMIRLIQRVLQQQNLTNEPHHKVPSKLTLVSMPCNIPRNTTRPQARKLKTRSNVKQRSTNKTSSNDSRSLRPLGPKDGDTIRKSPRQQTNRRSDTPEPQVDQPEAPQLLACLLILPRDAEPIGSLLRNLAASLPCTAALPFVGEADYATATADPWLKHEQAAHYLGISKSTLYQYASQEKIEWRKLGGRLAYLHSTLRALRFPLLRQQTNLSLQPLQPQFPPYGFAVANFWVRNVMGRAPWRSFRTPPNRSSAN